MACRVYRDGVVDVLLLFCVVKVEAEAGPGPGPGPRAGEEVAKVYMGVLARPEYQIRASWSYTPGRTPGDPTTSVRCLFFEEDFVATPSAGGGSSPRDRPFPQLPIAGDPLRP